MKQVALSKHVFQYKLILSCALNRTAYFNFAPKYGNNIHSIFYFEMDVNTCKLVRKLIVHSDPVHTGPDPYGHHINLKSLKTSMTLKFVITLQNLIKAYHRKSGKSKYDCELTELDVETTRIRSRVNGVSEHKLLTHSFTSVKRRKSHKKLANNCSKKRYNLRCNSKEGETTRQTR